MLHLVAQLPLQIAVMCRYGEMLQYEPVVAEQLRSGDAVAPGAVRIGKASR
jgi:hypothetical protein